LGSSVPVLSLPPQVGEVDREASSALRPPETKVISIDRLGALECPGRPSGGNPAPKQSRAQYGEIAQTPLRSFALGLLQCSQDRQSCPNDLTSKWGILTSANTSGCTVSIKCQRVGLSPHLKLPVIAHDRVSVQTARVLPSFPPRSNFSYARGDSSSNAACL
jgi:hypothetical protein